MKPIQLTLHPADPSLLRPRVETLVACLLIVFGLIARVWGWSYSSRDVEHFLEPWITHLGAHGFAGLASVDSNYNPPYLYLLLLGKLTAPELSPLSLVKWVSTVFDLALSAVVASAVRNGTRQRSIRPSKVLLAFALTFSLPTLWINSAVWGQCDAIFFTFLLLSLMAAERGQTIGFASGFMTAVAFKLQSVFTGPIALAVFWKQKYRAATLIAAMAVYVLWMLPAVLAGRKWSDALLVYFRQATSENELSFGAPNLWTVAKYLLATPGLQKTGLIVGLTMAVAFSIFMVVFGFRMMRNSREPIMALAFTCAFMVPFLLPKMHDRYMFPADMLALVLALRDRRWWPVALLVQIGSLTAYLGYLSSASGWLIRPPGIIANCVVVFLLAQFWVKLSRQKGAEERAL